MYRGIKGGVIMSVIESILERRNREVFTAKSVTERADVEIIIKDKQGRVLVKKFKDVVYNETAATFEHDAEYLELDFELKGKTYNFSQELKEEL